MNTHEMAVELLNAPCKEVTASVDLSTCDDDAHHRAFGTLCGLQYEPDNTVTLLFDCGKLNFAAR
jgi:hypothetical protein